MPLFFIVYPITAIIVGSFAARKNRNGLAWGLIGGLFLLPAMVVLAFMPYLCPRCQGALKNSEWKDRKCPVCGDLQQNTNMASYENQK
jgi:hypothetical protein